MKSKARSSLSWLLSILMVFTMMPAMMLTAHAGEIAGLALVVTVGNTPATPDGGSGTTYTVAYGDTVTLSVTATDPFSNSETYAWSVGGQADTGATGSAETYTVDTSTIDTTGKTYSCAVEDGTDSGSAAVTIKVDKREVTVTWATGDFLDTNAFTYNGAEQAPTVTIGNKANSSDDVSLVVTGKQTNAGTYNGTGTDGNKATVTGLTGDEAAFYKLPDSGLDKGFKINPKPVIVTAVDQVVAVEADLSEYFVGVQTTNLNRYVTTGSGALVDGHTLTSITLDCSQSTTGAASYPQTYTEAITPSSAVIMNGTTNVSNNYSVSYAKGDLTVKEKAATPEYTGPSNLSLTEGAIASADTAAKTLTITPASESAEYTYMWCKCADTERNYAEPIVPFVTVSSYEIPADTPAGTYYYFCIVGNEETGKISVSEPSSVATVTVTSSGGSTSTVGGGGGGAPISYPTSGTTTPDTPATPAQPVNTEPVVIPTPTDPSTQTVAGFSDVKASDYFAAPVAWAVSSGITKGTGEGTFEPAKDCTRGETLTFLWRSEGCPEPTMTTSPFKDVKPGDYFGKAVLWGVERGIVKGTSENTFSPDKTVNRADSVTFLYRAKGGAFAAGGNKFSDVDAGAYYAEAVNWAAGNGITTGTSSETFSPTVTCNRGQTVTFLFRANN